MSKKKDELSRSLQSLLGGVIGIETDTGKDVLMKLNPSDIQPNALQPRKVFNEDDMKDLVASVKKHGILQPVIVKPVAHGYMLIAGERRWRAAKQLKLKEIPAIVRHADELSALEIALIENIQRSDLNPIEKAKGFLELINKFHLTQEQVAQAVGKERSSVTNYIRLLDLPQEIQDYVSRETISMGHARAILSAHDKETQQRLCKQIIKNGLSVREVEAIVSNEKRGIKVNKLSHRKISPQILDLEDRFRMFFGTKVVIRENGGRGRIVISFNSNDEFDRITKTLGIHM